MSEDKQVKGLKKLRLNVTDAEPTHYCENCKCKRYTPCSCMRKKEK